MISKAYSYLFYRLYLRALEPGQSSIRSANSAMFTIFLSLVLYAYGLYGIYAFITGYNPLPIIGSTTAGRLLIVAVISLLLTAFTSFFVIKKIPAIKHQFQSESNTIKKSRTRYIWLYFIMCAISFILSACLQRYVYKTGFNLIDYLHQ
jgi:hypothetical protein